MNQTLGSARCQMHLRWALSLLVILGPGHAAGNTYFKCVDAKGSVTVQQTACAVSSSQEEKKVWTSRPVSAQPAPEPSPPPLRQPEKSQRQERK